MPIYVAVSYVEREIHGKRDENGCLPSSKRQELWGPFTEADANARMLVWEGEQQNYTGNHSHAHVFLKVEEGVPSVHRLAKDRGDWHPYRIHLTDGRIRVRRWDTFDLFRGEERILDVLVTDLSPGDIISVKRELGRYSNETVTRVERVELYWGEEE